MSNEKKIQPLKLPSLAGIKAVYFIGIGGIGMSALARYFHAKGVSVSGYDKTETPLTKELMAEGIAVHYTENVDAIPKDVDLIVYTPAVPATHAELIYYKEQEYAIVKRSDVLGAITNESFNICVAGTHGKTTISTMIAHVLRHSGYGCNAFLGGISSNYNTNFWSSETGVAVIEADEYDRSFLKLSPDIAVISAVDADHLDIYGDEASVQDAFVAFGNKIKEGGLLLSKFGLKRMREIGVLKKLSYSVTNDAADISASNIEIDEGGYRFDVKLPDKIISDLKLNVGGLHNVENAVAAIGVAHQLEIEPQKIRAAIADFKGVKRRFEYVIPLRKKQTGSYEYPVFIDDYAHHPEELKTLLKSARSLFPQRRLTVIFQPHLFSRTKDFAPQFSHSLSIADTILLLPVYAARELPTEGVTSELIAKGMENDNVRVLSKEEVLAWASEKDWDKEFGEVIITAGAGDIDTLVQPLKKIIEYA
jgi:UDP-N-acetylmuramate--alanine ligase